MMVEKLSWLFLIIAFLMIFVTAVSLHMIMVGASVVSVTIAAICVVLSFGCRALIRN